MKFNLEQIRRARFGFPNYIHFRHLEDQIGSHSCYRNYHLNNPACSDDYVSLKRLETHFSETTIGVC